MQTPIHPPQPPEQKAAGGRAQTVILSRFDFQRVDGGLLRLDTQSGEVALCSPHGAHWGCEIVPENNAAMEKATQLESENAKLRAEVTSLKAKLSEMQAARQPPPTTSPTTTSPPMLPPPPAAMPPADAIPPSHDSGVKLRIDNNVERLRAAIESAWRRMMTMLDDLERNVRRKLSRENTAI